mgnify:CR=1 FL=1
MSMMMNEHPKFCDGAIVKDYGVILARDHYNEEVFFSYGNDYESTRKKQGYSIEKEEGEDQFFEELEDIDDKEWRRVEREAKSVTKKLQEFTDDLIDQQLIKLINN